MQHSSGIRLERMVVVRGHDDGAVFLNKIVQKLQDAVGGLGIEVPRRFVGDEQGRLVQQLSLIHI